MNTEFRIATGWRIFLYIVMPLMAIGFIYMGVTPFLEPPSDQSMYIILPLLSIGLCALLAWGFIDIQRGKLVVENDRIIQVNAFRTKELPATLVKGYTEDQNYVIIHPAEEGFPTIKVSKYTGQLDALKDILWQRFPNLDEEQYAAEEQQLLEEETLGASEDERVMQLQQIRKLTRAINTLAWACGIWLIFYPRPYEIGIYAAMLFIPVVLYVVHRYKGLVKIDENPKSAYPNLSTAFMIPAIVLMLRAILDYSIFQFSQLWVLVVISTLVLYGITLAITRAYTDKKQLAKSLLLLLFLGCFSYGTLVQANCMEDQSVTQVYNTTVMGKRISSGKHTSYYLELAPWGPQTEAEDVDVPKALYDRVEEGQLMQVYFKKGRLGVPWFFVTD